MIKQHPMPDWLKVHIRLPPGMSASGGESIQRFQGARYREAPTVSAIRAPRVPSGFGSPVVVSRAV
jgi:hypothetical protein